MKVRSTLAAAAVITSLLAGVAWAQSKATANPTTAAGTATAAATPAATAGAANAIGTAAAPDTVKVPVWPKMEVPLAEQQPVQAQFALGQIEGVDPKLVAGVTAKGYARKVSVEDQTVGQVLVMSVAKADKEETISQEGLTAQFDAKETSSLFPERTVEVTGSKAALVAALERLNTTEKKEEKKTENSSRSDQVSSGSKNSDASSYRTPTVTATTSTSSSSPTTTVSTSTDGCEIRIDLAQGKAIQQNKTQTFEDGSLVSTSECSDSEVSYPLSRSYATCADIVDLTAMTAWPQYTLYYTGSTGETVTVGECTKDTDLYYAINEDESQCPISVDYTAQVAIPQAALVYTNRNNKLVQARGCEASTKTAPITMTESTSQCTIRHDFTAGLSYEMSMWSYIRDGVTYQAAPCTDNGKTFTHQTVYTDTAGNYICTPITDMTAKTVTLQSRKAIAVGGQTQYITECTPDTTSKAILATTDDCMDPSKWTHDIGAGVSYGQERYYYSKADGSRNYITQCQNSTTTYVQSQEITGYQYHDAQLYAYPLMSVSISVNGTPYVIKQSEVLAGAAQLVYVLDGTADKQTGQSTYDGCNAYRATTRYEQWKRPDDTVYEKQIGEGTPVGPVNVCVEVVADSRQMESGVFCTAGTFYGGGDSGDTASYGSYFSTINKIKLKNNETGSVISEYCNFSGSWDSFVGNSYTYTSSSAGAGSSNGFPPSSKYNCVWGTNDTKSTKTQTLSVPPCPF